MGPVDLHQHMTTMHLLLIILIPLGLQRIRQHFRAIATATMMTGRSQEKSEVAGRLQSSQHPICPAADFCESRYNSTLLRSPWHSHR